MSAIANQVHLMLKKIFPANPHRRVFPEHYVQFKGARLFFDFYVKEMDVFIEVQGRQHTKFVKHFHGTKKNFDAQRYRDNLKLEYVQEQGMSLARFNYDEKITEELVREKISKAMEGCFYE